MNAQSDRQEVKPLRSRACRRGASIALASLLSASAAPAIAAETVPPSLSGPAIVSKVIHREPRLHTSECALSIRFHETSFPYLGKTINGVAYFEPGRFSAVFKNVPGVLRTFPGAYDAMMNVGSWQHRFSLTTDKPQPLAGHTDAVVHLLARDPSSGLQYGRAFVNPKTWSIDGMDWHFKGMQFNITQTYKTLGSFSVLAGQQATIKVPIARAAATATFGNYHTNVALASADFPSNR